MQTKRQSFVEALTNAVISYLVVVFAGVVVYPLYGMHPSLADNFQLTAVFTVISIIRSYLVRRFYNWRHHEPRSTNASPTD